MEQTHIVESITAQWRLNTFSFACYRTDDSRSIAMVLCGGPAIRSNDGETLVVLRISAGPSATLRTGNLYGRICKRRIASRAKGQWTQDQVLTERREQLEIRRANTSYCAPTVRVGTHEP
jgi:hypothetical protein